MHSHDVEVGPRTRRLLALTATLLAVATVVGMVVLRPGSGASRPDISAFTASDFFDARVAGAAEGECASVPAESGITCAAVTFELLAGPDVGDTVVLDFPDSPSTPRFVEGETVVLGHYPGGDGVAYSFADRQRKPTLLWLAVLFAVAVVVLGRLRGAAALGGLVASVAVLLFFALPAIIDGRDPVAVAVVAASAISFFALYLAHGFRPMTTVALLGTLASLSLTAVLATVFVGLAQFSGFSTEEAIFLQGTGGDLDLQGLILAGVIIGALGALDDMTVTQAAAVWELRSASPDLPPSRLMAAGLRIGRDHVASTVNTLVLAYVGASMPLMLLFVLSRQSLGDVANSEVVAIEIVRTLVGSIGLVASVPLTTWLAARTAAATASGGRRAAP